MADRNKIAEGRSVGGFAVNGVLVVMKIEVAADLLLLLLLCSQIHFLILVTDHRRCPYNEYVSTIEITSLKSE